MPENEIEDWPPGEQSECSFDRQQERSAGTSSILPFVIRGNAHVPGGSASDAHDDMNPVQRLAGNSCELIDEDAKEFEGITTTVYSIQRGTIFYYLLGNIQIVLVL